MPGIAFIMTKTSFYIGDLAVGAPGSFRPGRPPVWEIGDLDREAIAFIGASVFTCPAGAQSRPPVAPAHVAMLTALENAFRPAATARQTAAGRKANTRTARINRT